MSIHQLYIHTEILDSRALTFQKDSPVSVQTWCSSATALLNLKLESEYAVQMLSLGSRARLPGAVFILSALGSPGCHPQETGQEFQGNTASRSSVACRSLS